MKQVSIDYEKYSQMNSQQLRNSLASAERKKIKIKEDLTNKLAAQRELIKFIKARLKELPKAEQKSKAYVNKDGDLVVRLAPGESYSTAKVLEIAKEKGII